jgi:hypothetical protein
MAARLKMSAAERARLVLHAMTARIDPAAGEAALARMLYRGDPQAICDRLGLALISARGLAAESDTALHDAARLTALLRFAVNWRKPIFPVSGADLKAGGAVEGPELGARLKALEERWIESGFRAGRDELLGSA